jgi:hypothetical protein
VSDEHHPERRTRLVTRGGRSHLLVPEDGEHVRAALVAHFEAEPLESCIDFIAAASGGGEPWIDHDGILHVGGWSVFPRGDRWVAEITHALSPAALLIVHAALDGPPEGEWQVREVVEKKAALRPR